MYLDRNPEWKTLASQEAEQILGLKDNVDYSDLNSLAIISNCLKESLRLAPPASIIGLQPTEDFRIPPDQMWDEMGDNASSSSSSSSSSLPPVHRQVGKKTVDNALSSSSSASSSSSSLPPIHRQVGKKIPPGTRVLLSIYTMHRHSRFWSNADAFKPDRWAAKTKETSIPMTFIPFSMGSRNCIGQVFAQMEAKIILSRFLRAFNYESLDGEKPDEWDESLTLYLRRGLTVRLKPKE